MKKINLTILFFLLSLTGFSQTKDTFFLKSIPTYDEFGNYYQVIERFTYPPTKSDSIQFEKESRIEMTKFFDSLRKTYYVPKRKKNKL
jgi:hypothetical protein